MTCIVPVLTLPGPYIIREYVHTSVDLLVSNTTGHAGSDINSRLRINTVPHYARATFKSRLTRAIQRLFFAFLTSAKQKVIHLKWVTATSFHAVSNPSFILTLSIRLTYIRGCKVKDKGKVVPVHNKAPRQEDVLGEWRYSSTHSWPRHYMEVSGQVHGPAALPPGNAPGTHWIGGWVGPRAILDAVVKRKIPNPRRESNPTTPIIQPVAQRYTDWAITALHTRVYPKISGLAAWRGNCKWYSSLPLGAVLSLFCESV
jgi:hypothetical protein